MGRDDRPRIIRPDRRTFLRLTGAAAAWPFLGSGCEGGTPLSGLPGEGQPVPPGPPTGPPPVSEELAFDPLAVPLDPVRFPSACMAGNMSPTAFLVAGYVVAGGPRRGWAMPLVQAVLPFAACAPIAVALVLQDAL